MILSIDVVSISYLLNDGSCCRLLLYPSHSVLNPPSYPTGGAWTWLQSREHNIERLEAPPVCPQTRPKDKAVNSWLLQRHKEEMAEAGCQGAHLTVAVVSALLGSWVFLQVPTQIGHQRWTDVLFGRSRLPDDEHLVHTHTETAHSRQSLPRQERYHSKYRVDIMSHNNDTLMWKISG